VTCGQVAASRPFFWQKENLTETIEAKMTSSYGFIDLHKQWYNLRRLRRNSRVLRTKTRPNALVDRYDPFWLPTNQ
jgi:hypothetical protein